MPKPNLSSAPSPTQIHAMRIFTHYGLSAPVTEYRFHPERRWRFDYAWVEDKIALEVEGGIWTGGRHTSATGFLKDIEKYNTATALGWRVLRCTPKTLVTLSTIQLIKDTRHNKSQQLAE